MALCLARLTDEGEGEEPCQGASGGREAKVKNSEQDLKDEEINLPGGRQPQSVLHKAVLGPPRTMAGGGAGDSSSWDLCSPTAPLASRSGLLRISKKGLGGLLGRTGNKGVRRRLEAFLWLS